MDRAESGQRKLRRTACCGVLLMIVLETVTAVGAGQASAARQGPSAAVPHGWQAHSAYGIQIAVPVQWTVRYFQNCPGRGPGTLLIGNPLVYVNCVMIPSDANIVTMSNEMSPVQPDQDTRVTHIVIDGMNVTRITRSTSAVTLDIPSKNAVIGVSGPATAAVTETVRPATARSLPAPGMVRGSERLDALEQVNVTGPIGVARFDAGGSSLPPLHAYDGAFWSTLRPGRYELTGHAGSAPCPPVVVSLESGLTSTVAIICQGT